MSECSVMRQTMPFLLTESLDRDQRELTHQHIENCETCGEEWAAYRETWGVLGDLPQMEVPSRVRDRFLTLDGRRIHYLDWGDESAPPLLLLHGSLLHAHTWDPVARGLADQYRVIAPDWRGHGESDWAKTYSPDDALGDLEALIGTLGLARFALVGNSIGGRFAPVYAATHPDQVTHVVMLQGFVAGSSPPEVGQ